MYRLISVILLYGCASAEPLDACLAFADAIDERLGECGNPLPDVSRDTHATCDLVRTDERMVMSECIPRVMMAACSDIKAAALRCDGFTKL